MNTTTCEKCGTELQVGDYPFCPHGRGAGGAIGDECDVVINHGLCHEDGSSRRFRSKSEIQAEAKRRGLVNVVRHIDGSPHTKRWI
jgi:hypothetical protein